MELTGMNFNFAGYLIYASIMSITPGPNNLMLFSYGKAYGVGESKKIMLGILSGFSVMLCLAGYGIAGAITGNPTAGLVLKIAGSLWMLYLALILRKITVDLAPGKKVLIGFGEAFFMQFINIKAWVMAITGAAAFLPRSGSIHLNVFIFTASFGIVGIPCMFIWLKMGDLIAKIIRSEKSNRRLGNLMFWLMIFTIVLIWI
jgi:threonine/homoserine/homoserine lactone efflux protein